MFAAAAARGELPLKPIILELCQHALEQVAVLSGIVDHAGSKRCNAAIERHRIRGDEVDATYLDRRQAQSSAILSINRSRANVDS